MRYAVIEILPPNVKGDAPILRWVATDLSKSSAIDALKAWGYQAGTKGGYMDIIEDTDEAFQARKAVAVEFAFKD